MAERVLVRSSEGKQNVVVAWTQERVWPIVGWIGVVLTVAALLDYAVSFIPTHFSSMEWEFGTIAQVFAGLPLLLIGLVAIWISGAMLGLRWVLMTIGVVLGLATAVVLVLLVAFALDVPVAIKLNPGAAREQVVKLVVKTVFMALLFGASFLYTGVLALKQARGTPAGEVHT